MAIPKQNTGTKKKSVRATLIELFSRITKVDENSTEKIYTNGENNLYPNEIELVINNSPTASRAQKIMAKFIEGDGLTDASQNVLTNPKKEERLTDVISAAATDISYQYGVFFWRSFGFNEQGELIPNRLEVLEYDKCRISKEDDEENAGKIWYEDYTNEDKGFGKKKESKRWFFPYSDNPDVIMAQIKSGAKEGATLEDMIKGFRGQAYYLNLTPRYKYALSPVDSVFNEADTEYRMSVYTNTQTRLGFLGKTLVVTQGLDEEASEQISENIQGWLGAEESANMMHMDVEQTDNLDNVIKVIQLKAQYDDKLFEKTKVDCKRAILGAFNNIPEALVIAGDTLFGVQADAYKEMKLFYSEQTKGERKKLAECLTKLGFPCQIKPLIEPKLETPQPETQTT